MVSDRYSICETAIAISAGAQEAEAEAALQRKWYKKGGSLSAPPLYDPAGYVAGLPICPISRLSALQGMM